MTDQRRTIYRQALPVILLLILGLFAIGPLLQPGYFWGAHDARHDVYFLFEFDQSVQSGNWFPRWGPDWAFGYGYPFWIIYAPLAVMTGEIFHHFAGLGWEASVKAAFALSILLSGLGMYGFVRSWLGRRAALVAAVAYMLIPYHLVDVYVRAALPESLALAWLPLVLWGFRATVYRPRLASILGAALAYAALWWTHNLTAAIFSPALAVYVAALLWWKIRPERPDAEAVTGPEIRQSESAAHAGALGIVARPAIGPAPWLARYVTAAGAPAAAFVLALGLSAAFLLPALAESRNVNQAQWFGLYYNPFQHFVYFNQLFNPAWGFGISAPGPDDVAKGSLSYQLGAAPTLLALLSLFTAGRLDRRLRRELWLLALFAAGAIFLALNISAPFWRLPVVPYAQFPWRYLLIAIPFLSILAGAVLAPASAETQAGVESDSRADVSGPAEGSDWPALLLAGLLLLSSYPYLRAEMRAPTPEQGPVSYAALMRFQRTSNEMTGVTAWVDPAQIPTWSAMADEWVAGRPVTTRVDYSQVPQNDTLAVNAEGMGADYEQVWYHAGQGGQTIAFNRFWYPGWKAYLLDGKGGRPVQELPVERESGPLARVRVPVPQGEHYLLLRFEDTPLRRAAQWITYVTLALIAALLIVRGWQTRSHRPHLARRPR